MTDVGELLAPTSPTWARALERVPHDVYHQPAYVSADAQHQHGEPVAWHYEDDGHVVLLPLVLRDVPGGGALDAVSPYGYPGPVSNAPAGAHKFWRRAAGALVEGLSAAGVVSAFVRLHPVVETPLHVLADAGDVVRHGETVSIDLSLTVEQIWGGTRATHRNEINRARRADISVQVDQWDLLDEWTELYHQTMQRLEADPTYLYSRAHFALLRETVPHMHLFLAHDRDVVVAGQVVFEHAGLVQTHLSATRSGTRRTHADKLLYDEVRRWAKKRGARLHHLGGGLGGRQDGLFAFKAGFGSGRHPFHTWRVVVDPEAYRRLTATAHARGFGSPGDGFFPAYRALASSPAPAPVATTRPR